VIDTGEILESLDLSRAEPGIGFLEALFARFNARVPFENATKILRDREIVDPLEKPRRPELFWSEHLSAGAGGTCFARVEAFRELLEALGFSVVRALGRVSTDGDHTALFVERDGRSLLCDVGFPLPAILPAAPGRYPTSGGTLEVARTPGGLAVAFADGVPEGPRSLEVFSRPVSPEEFEDLWRATFRPEAPFLSGVRLRIPKEGRTVSFSFGAARVDDLHSRLIVPLARPRARPLSELFGVEERILEGALASTGDPDPDPALGGGSLAAYLETPASADEAFASIATAENYRALAEGLGRVSVLARTEGGFRLRVAAGEGRDGDPFIEEEATVDPSGRRLRVLRREAGGEKRFESRAESRDGRTFLIREARFDAPREDLLRNDALRGRLAGSLAVDLLAWARRIGRQE
jgi:hypothetical protein